MVSLNFAKVGGLAATVRDAVATLDAQELKSQLILNIARRNLLFGGVIQLIHPM